MQFLCVQALGIALEDGVQAAYCAIVRGDTNGGKSKPPPSLWKRIIGYVWVAIWMAWSVPVYVYPQSRRDRGEGVLPMSVVKRFL